MLLDVLKIAVTTTGNAGAASGNTDADHPISGEIEAIYVDWDASAPATSDITITIKSDPSHPTITLYSKANSVADAWVYPRVQATDTSGAAITGWYVPIVGEGLINVAIVQSDALTTACTVYVFLKRG